ncbi:MAG: ArsA-related P-loop ATPase [Thermoleophilaceae bacterium]
MTEVLDKRLVFITGKGGVGRTTVATALGLAATGRGKRTLICELSSQERIARSFGHDPVGYEETEVASDLFLISLDPQRALEEYLGAQVGSQRLSNLLFNNRIFEYFLAAAPGIRELATVGKAWDLAQPKRRDGGEPFDLVIVDAPASGHGLAMLMTPRTFGEIARVGPVRRRASMIEEFITDPGKTGVMAVALAQEMPVTETIEFREKLHEGMGMETDVVVVNALMPERFTAEEAAAIERAGSANGAPDAAAALRAALSEHGRSRAERTQLRRLRRELGEAITLPFVWQPELDADSLTGLAAELERKL